MNITMYDNLPTLCFQSDYIVFVKQKHNAMSTSPRDNQVVHQIHQSEDHWM